MYCTSCHRWIPNTANAEMRKEGVYAHSHFCVDGVNKTPDDGGMDDAEEDGVGEEMGKYIEKGKATEIIERLAEKCGNEEMAFALNWALRLIRDIPEQEVKRGNWVKARGSWCTPGGDPVWECSECGKGTHVYGIEHGTYGADIADGQWVACPNCGADMREEQT